MGSGGLRGGREDLSRQERLERRPRGQPPMSQDGGGESFFRFMLRRQNQPAAVKAETPITLRFNQRPSETCAASCRACASGGAGGRARTRPSGTITQRVRYTNASELHRGHCCPRTSSQSRQRRAMRSHARQCTSGMALDGRPPWRLRPPRSLASSHCFTTAPCRPFNTFED